MEEVYFVVKGSGRMVIDGEEIEERPGRFVRVDGASTRIPVSGDDASKFVTFGAPVDGAYEPPCGEVQPCTRSSSTARSGRLLYEALHSYLDDFGHEEADVLGRSRN